MIASEHLELTVLLHRRPAKSMSSTWPVMGTAIPFLILYLIFYCIQHVSAVKNGIVGFGISLSQDLCCQSCHDSISSLYLSCTTFQEDEGEMPGYGYGYASDGGNERGVLRYQLLCGIPMQIEYGIRLLVTPNYLVHLRQAFDTRGVLFPLIEFEKLLELRSVCFLVLLVYV